jgi:uncharacterized protein
MKTKLLHAGAQKTWAVVFQTGEEATAGLKQFAREQNLSAAQVTAIGAFSSLKIAYFSIEKNDYKYIPITEQVEVLSLMGDIALKDNEPQLHLHVVVGKSDGTAHGGHLAEARVRPTLEVIITESPRHLHRKIDPETGLALIDLDV